MRKELIAPTSHSGGASGDATQAVRAGNFIFVGDAGRTLQPGPLAAVFSQLESRRCHLAGGQRSLDRNGKLLSIGDIATQTANAFRNLETALREGGGDRNNLMRQNT
jgi:enamine deaminase RidA (YjgF/YER057c/UK114 family)